MPQHRVLAQPGVVGADVHRVVGPVGDPHDGQPSGVADDEFDVVGVGSAAAVVDDHDGFGEFLDPDLQVAVGDRAFARSGDGDLDRLGDLRCRAPTVTMVASLNDENACAATRSAGTPPWPSRSSPRRTVSTVTPGCSETLIARAAGGRRGAVVQAAQPLERGEPPELVAAAGHLEGVDVEGGEQLALVGDGSDVSPWRHLLSLRFCATHPTAPSICSSISRLSSRAYSIGSSLAMGSTKPRTTIAIASSSVMPRLIR